MNAPQRSEARDAMIDDSPQNIYDDPVFFAGYKKLRREDTGLNGSIEVPELRRLLPDLAGLQIIDLGCGFGDFARYASMKGAASVSALDVSQKMINEAINLTDADNIIYVRSSIEEFRVDAASFDVAVSSMALHYVENFEGVACKIFHILKPGGHFVFSVEHPVCTANPRGWVLDEHSQKLFWPLDRYQDETARSTAWFVDGVKKFHRTIETYVNTLISAGFQISYLGEPKPVDKYLQLHPWLEETLRRPPILMLAAMKAK
nr:class I SAM-dependent methyltransferase [Brucella intermedia]